MQKFQKSVKILLRNHYVFQGAYLGNKKFRKELLKLIFKWHSTKDFIQSYLKEPWKWETDTLGLIIKKNYESLFNVIKLADELFDKFWSPLNEKEKTEFHTDILNILKIFKLKPQWYSPIAKFVILLWMCPPLSKETTKRKVSLKSLIALEKFRNLSYTRLQPKWEDKVRNFYKSRRFSKYSGFIGIIPSLKTKKEVENIAKQWRSQGYKIPKHIPNFKYLLTDEQAIRRLYPKLNNKEAKREMLNMQKVRERLGKLP